MFLALIEPGTYLDFIRPVPFSGAEGVIERGVLNEAGAISGRAQAAVRPLSPADFARIVSAGLAGERHRAAAGRRCRRTLDRVQDLQAPFHVERPIIERLIAKPERKAFFRRAVLQAYEERCAVTGWKLINGGGRAEAEAAHIKPVEHGGPDSIQNGIALSGTAHWMFDRGLIGFSDELDILVSRQVNDRPSVEAIDQQDRPGARAGAARIAAAPGVPRLASGELLQALSNCISCALKRRAPPSPPTWLSSHKLRRASPVGQACRLVEPVGLRSAGRGPDYRSSGGPSSAWRYSSAPPSSPPIASSCGKPRAWSSASEAL